MGETETVGSDHQGREEGRPQPRMYEGKNEQSCKDLREKGKGDSENKCVQNATNTRRENEATATAEEEVASDEERGRTSRHRLGTVIEEPRQGKHRARDD